MATRPGEPADRGFPPISDYAFLSDCRSCALVARDASVEWACFHRFDARPIFARILDRDRGGWFRICPAGPFEASRRYLPDTNVLETRFETEGGAVTVVDCLPLHRDPESPGRTRPCDPRGLLLRVVRGLAGSVELSLDYHPRFEYGLTTPFVQLLDGDLALATGGPESVLLQSELGPLATDAAAAGCRASAVVQAGETRVVALTVAGAGLLDVRRLDHGQLLHSLEETIAFWQAWVGLSGYEGPYAEGVRRSMLVLKGLTADETGAIAAAATTSLPEEIGGARNWDYRYCWLRDSAALLGMLLLLGHVYEAQRFSRWLQRTTAGKASELQIMYGIGGERLLHEAELPWLSGYRSSRPVRVGNGAWDQFQLDTYGELVTAAWFGARMLLSRGRRAEAGALPYLVGIVEQAIARWREPDEGIWEVRGERQHFVFSKLAAWLALDRGIRIVERAPADVGVDLERWRSVRDEIRATIEREGVDPDTGAFVQALGSRALDASALQVVLRGFVPPDDPRALATIEAVEQQLTRNGHVYRYRSPDGLEGDEGTFVFCTLWLASAEALVGRPERARERLELVLSSASDLGLLGEEIDAETGELLGNYPQAFSHIGVVAAASMINWKERGGTGHPYAPLE